MRRGLRSLILVLLVLPLFVFPPPSSDVGANPGQFTVLASGLKDPRGIAISNGYVYWSDGSEGTISRIPVEGGNVTLIAKGGREPLRIAVDGGYVYWTDFSRDTISRVPVDGGQIKVLASNQDHPEAILVKDGYVYWAEYLLGNIKRVPVDGSGAIEAIVTGRFGVSGFAIDNGYVYWAEGTIQGADVSRIDRASLQGGEPRLFVKTVKPWAITIRAGYLFWTEYRWGGVFKVPLAGGQIDTIKPPISQNDDFQITSDDLNVYWTVTRTGSVQSTPVAGGAVITLAANRTGPYDIASDGSHLVWTEEGAGNVMLYTLTQKTPGTFALAAGIVATLVGLFVIAITLKNYRHSKRMKYS